MYVYDMLGVLLRVEGIGLAQQCDGMYINLAPSLLLPMNGALSSALRKVLVISFCPRSIECDYISTSSRDASPDWKAPRMPIHFMSGNDY